LRTCLGGFAWESWGDHFGEERTPLSGGIVPTERKEDEAEAAAAAEEGAEAGELLGGVRPCGLLIHFARLSCENHFEFRKGQRWRTGEEELVWHDKEEQEGRWKKKAPKFSESEILPLLQRKAWEILSDGA